MELALIAGVCLWLLYVLIIMPWIVSRRLRELKERLDQVNSDSKLVQTLIKKQKSLQQEVSELRRGLKDLSTGAFLIREPSESGVPVQEPPVEAPVSPSPHPLPKPVIPEPPPLPVRPEAPQPFLLSDIDKKEVSPPGKKLPKKPPSKLFDLEETLGTNWLLKIGMALVVVGVALFLGYTLQKLGPWGKVLIAFSASGAAIMGGWIMEKRKNYITFGRVLLSGGWALAYFTTYAMHNIEATRVLQSDLTGFLAMLLVAAGMVIHSLHYRSQFVTAFAYGLAYLTLMISPVQWPTLIAGVLLSVSIVLILRRMKWYALEILAITCTYASHFLWLYPILHDMGGLKKPFSEYEASSILLGAYWVIFAISHFLRRPASQSQDSILQFGLILNTMSYVSISSYQSVHPELAFRFLLILGISHFGLAYLSTLLKRRGSYLVTSTIGAILIVAAAPYKYSGSRLTFFWLALVEILLAVGYRLKEIHFRRLAWISTVPLTGYLYYHDILPGFQRFESIDTAKGILLLTTGLAFTVNALYLGRKYATETGADSEEKQTHASYLYLGWSLIFAAVWFLVSFQWLAVVWLALAFLFEILGVSLQEKHLRILAQISVLFAGIRELFVIQTSSSASIAGISMDTIIGIGVALLMYAFGELSRRHPFVEGREDQRQNWLNAPFATLILAFLCWYSLSPTSIALGWGILSLVLLEVGRSWKLPDLRWQGHTMAAAAFIRVLVVNLNAVDRVGTVSIRLITILPLVAMFYYLFDQLRRDHLEDRLSPLESTNGLFPAMYSYFGLICLLGVCRFELPEAWVAVSWSAISICLITAGIYGNLKIFRTQAILLTFLVLARCLFENFYMPDERLLSVGTVVVIFLLGFSICRTLSPPRNSDLLTTKFSAIRRLLGACDRNPRHFYFFSAVGLITSLIWIDTSSGFLTAAWAVEAFVVFIVAVILNERIYRLFGMGLLLVCTIKVILIDVWKLETLQRIIAFIVLGMALLSVSYLYTRYGEAWRKLLLGK